MLGKIIWIWFTVNSSYYMKQCAYAGGELAGKYTKGLHGLGGGNLTFEVYDNTKSPSSDEFAAPFKALTPGQVYVFANLDVVASKQRYAART